MVKEEDLDPSFNKKRVFLVAGLKSPTFLVCLPSNKTEHFVIVDIEFARLGHLTI